MAMVEAEAVVSRRSEESTYVVAIAQDIDVPEGGAVTGWVDVATVTVPARTKRRRVIREALEQAGLSPGAESLRVRVLDESSARETPVGPEQRDPEWAIG